MPRVKTKRRRFLQELAGEKDPQIDGRGGHPQSSKKVFVPFSKPGPRMRVAALGRPICADLAGLGLIAKKLLMADVDDESLAGEQARSHFLRRCDEVLRRSSPAGASSKLNSHGDRTQSC